MIDNIGNKRESSSSGMLFKKMQNTAAKKKLFWFSMLCCKLYFFLIMLNIWLHRMVVLVICCFYKKVVWKWCHPRHLKRHFLPFEVFEILWWTIFSWTVICLLQNHCIIIRASWESKKKRFSYRKKYIEEFVWGTSLFWLHALFFFAIFCRFLHVLAPRKD